MRAKIKENNVNVCKWKPESFVYSDEDTEMSVMVDGVEVRIADKTEIIEPDYVTPCSKDCVEEFLAIPVEQEGEELGESFSFDNISKSLTAFILLICSSSRARSAAFVSPNLFSSAIVQLRNQLGYQRL